MEYYISDIIQALKASYQGTVQSTPVDTLLIDSRKLVTPSTSLFFALKGPRRDGHVYIGPLYNSGVRSFVVSERVDPAPYPDACFIIVPDTLLALQQLAAYHRKKFSMEVIGITGSNGKTIVKEWLYQLLHTDYSIIRSPKSYNSQIGVPLSVWQISEANNLAIFEAGISTRREMEMLEKIIHPTIGILTNIGSAHSEGFIDEAEKLREKLQLFKHAQMLIANGDADHIRNAVADQNIPALFWGKSAANVLQVKSIDHNDVCSTIRLNYKKESFTVSIPFIDDASVENAISCIALLLFLDLPPTVIMERMKLLHPVNMRLELLQGINNCVIINDSYSADITSLNIALQFLQQKARDKKRTVILSDFPDQQENERVVYSKIFDLLKRYAVQHIIGIGHSIQKNLLPLIEKSDIRMEKSFYHSAKDFEQAFHSSHFSNEVILIKGARVFHFEDITSLLQQKQHETVLEINLDAVTNNLAVYRNNLKPGVKMMVMVKAFAYGSGSVEIADFLQYHQVDYLGVAYADEGVELRKAGITLPVMVLNTETEAFDLFIEYNLEPVIYSFPILELFQRHLEGVGISHFPVHIEVETGMHRLGFEVEEMTALGERLRENNFIIVKSVYSHLAASEDNVEDEFTRSQYHRLMDAVHLLQPIIGYPFLRHIANSAAITRFPEMQLDMVRLGVGLYGIYKNRMPGLQTVVTLKTTVAQLKKIKASDTVSYNRKGRVTTDAVIAIIGIGYADGYSRRLSNGVGKVCIHGRLAPVIGTICMDMTIIDVTHIPDVKTGDEVIIFGESPTVEELAEWAGTIPYEIMTGISQRVKRVYFGET